MAKKPTLEELSHEYDAARKALVAGINREFPKGSRVLAWMSTGYMAGTVATESYSDRVIVTSENTGRCHHKHFSLVKRA